MANHHNHSLFSSWKDLFAVNQGFGLRNDALYEVDIDRILWSKAALMSNEILNKLSFSVPIFNKEETQIAFQRNCYQWLLNCPEINFMPADNLNNFHNFSFNEKALMSEELLSRLEVFRAESGNLVCKIPDAISSEKLPVGTKALIVNITSISYDIWQRKVVNEHRMEYIMNAEGDVNKDRFFLMPVQPAEQMLTLTVASVNQWSVYKGLLHVNPNNSKPSMIIGSTYN